MDVIHVNGRNCDMELNNKLFQRLFNLSYGIFLVYCLVGHIGIFHRPLQLLTNVAMFFLIAGFFAQYRICTKKELFTYVGIMAIALVTSLYNNNYGLFKLVLFAGSIKWVDFKEIVKFDLIVRIALIIFVYLLCRAGIATDEVFFYNGIARHSLGFTNPNALGVAVYIVACDIVYLAGNKINFKHISVLVIIALWLYYIARSRTAVTAIALLIILSIFYKLFPRIFHTKSVKALFICSPLVFTIMTYLCVKGLDSGHQAAQLINVIMSNRGKAVLTATRMLKPTLLGQPIGQTLEHSLDNAYGFIWYDLGILISLLMLYATIKGMIRYFKTNNIMLCIIMFVFLAYGLSEHLWLFVDYNIFMLAWCFNVKVADESIVEGEL